MGHWPFELLKTGYAIVENYADSHANSDILSLASSHTFIAYGGRLETADTVPLAAWNLFGETLQLYTSSEHILSIVLLIREKKISSHFS